MKQQHIYKLSKILSEKTKEYNLESDEKKQLIDLVDDLVIVWCRESACLYTQILQNLSHAESEDQIDGGKICRIQCLVLAKPPIWDVKCIKLNKTSTGVLLIGNEGIGVVELPKRWGNQSLFEGGNDNLTCRTEYVGKQFFSCNIHLKIVSADWHPGSSDQSRIVVLSSDNYLRIYNVSYLDIPDQAIAVGRTRSNFSSESGKFGVGESAVAFGIGPPLSSQKKESKSPFTEKSDFGDIFIEELEKQKKNFEELLWPFFILYNNGNVYYMLTSLNKKIYKPKMFGPLSMQPSSFDNYGIDFCSLLVLPSSPMVLVIANTKGFLHHCIVMEGSTPEHTDEDVSISMSRLNLESPSVYLHVYESVSLNLSYAASSSAFTSPIALTPDPNTPARYLVSHSEGCHGVSVPLVERLIPQDMTFPESDLESHVEHLLCTRPVTSSSPCTVVGVCMASFSQVFVLLSSGSIQGISLPSILMPRLPQFHIHTPGESDVPSFGKNECFESHIRSILQRSSSQPLLVSASGEDPSPEEYLKLIKKVKEMLRENYIRPQIKARVEIARRQNILLDQKEHLKNELSALKKEKNNLTDKAHELAEKYEEANDKHFQVMKRVEVVVGNLVRGMPVLSSSETRMLEELQEMSRESKKFEGQLSLIQSKSQWQTAQMEKEKSNEELKKQSESTLSENQITCLKLCLAKENDKLSALVKRVNQIKKEVGL